MSAAQGKVEAIYIATKHGELPHEVDVAVAQASRGIEAEAFDDLKARHGFEITPLESRRQVLVRGVNLGEFVGRRFQVGDVECDGEERCEPCNHLAKMVGTQDVLRGLLHTGLRAVIVKSGTIRAGDAVRLSAVAERL